MKDDVAVKCKVLVVDDEIRLADTLALILQQAGYEAQAAYDALAALEQCEQSLPDLIISDVVMPGMNGIEMAITIQHKFPQCRIVLFSGQAATAGLLDCASEQGHSFELLAKPIHPKELLARVADLCKKEETVNPAL